MSERSAVYIAADAEHDPEPLSDWGDHIYDHCARCGLSATSDGRFHGDDGDMVPTKQEGVDDNA